AARRRTKSSGLRRPRRRGTSWLITGESRVRPTSSRPGNAPAPRTGTGSRSPRLITERPGNSSARWLSISRTPPGGKPPEPCQLASRRGARLFRRVIQLHSHYPPIDRVGHIGPLVGHRDIDRPGERNVGFLDPGVRAAAVLVAVLAEGRDRVVVGVDDLDA